MIEKKQTLELLWPIEDEKATNVCAYPASESRDRVEEKGRAGGKVSLAALSIWRRLILEPISSPHGHAVSEFVDRSVMGVQGGERT